MAERKILHEAKDRKKRIAGKKDWKEKRRGGKKE